ncbi:MAG: hypothetical protein JNN18_20265 [Rubrivivax sp.]|nr:hypothetical protein [Rubrivivax sp.]
MADKQLTDAAWKSFAKGKGYKDTALLKALDGVGKGEKAGPGALLEALAALDKAADDLRKAHKGDKELGNYLDEVGKAAERERKGAEKDRKAAEAEAEVAAAQGAEDDEGPAVLTTKMVPLVRLAKKGDPLHTLIAVAGKLTAVMLSRKTISVARRKLLNELLGVSGGVKYIDGNVVLEANVVTFVVQAQAAGLGKRIRQALLEQTGERLKVRVRGLDPNDIDEDIGDDAAAAPGDAAAQGTVPEAPPLPPQSQPPAPPLRDEAAGFNSRLKALVPRVQQAVAGQHPQVQDIRLKVSEAGALARKSDFARAQALLEEVEALLGVPPAGAPAATPAAPPAPAAAPVNPQRFVNHARARLAWAGSRQRVAADLQKLEAAILAHYQGDEDLPELAQSVRQLDRILAELDESLADKLDEALNASDVTVRAQLHEQAREILARYGRFVDTDSLLAALDANPFVPLTTHKTLMAALQVLDKSLA